MALPTSVVSAKPASHAAGLLVFLVREGEKLIPVDGVLDGLFSRCAKEEEFTGKEGQMLSLQTPGRTGAERIGAIGIGKERDADRTLDQLRTAASRAVKLAKSAGAKSLAIVVPAADAAQVQSLAEGASLGAYVFDRYKKEKKPLKLSRVELLLEAKPPRALPDAARLGCEIADAVCAARDLVNEPPRNVTPRALAAEARKMAQQAGLKCEVLGRAQVEVLNTDAEGRLVLADVLAWAVEDKPAALVDLATLTGAILVALGPWTAGLFSNDEQLASELLACARRAGEPLWRMPLPAEMEELIKSPVADLKNTGGRFGGSINAALFLQHFVGKVPWAHLDIAGPASIDKDRGYNSRGGTGAGVRLLAEWIRRRAEATPPARAAAKKR